MGSGVFSAVLVTQREVYIQYGTFILKRADVSKKGVDDGNIKGVSSLQPAKENRYLDIKK